MPYDYKFELCVRFFRFWAYVRCAKIREIGKKPNDLDVKLIIDDCMAYLEAARLVEPPEGRFDVLH